MMEKETVFNKQRNKKEKYSVTAQRDVQFRQISWENPSLRRLVRMVRNVRLKMEKLNYKSYVQERIFDY